MLEFDDRPRGVTRLIYASRALGGPVSADLVQSIVMSSIQNNRVVDVTGLLIVGGDQFLQLLEGPTGGVEEVYARVRGDPRHGDLKLIARGTVDRRLFRSWNLAHRRLSPEDVGLLASVGLEAFTPADLDEDRAVRLLRAFGQGHLR